MAFYVFGAATADGTINWRTGSFPSLADLDAELGRQEEQLYDAWELPEAVARLRDLFKGRPRPLEVAEFCSTLSLYVAGGLDLQSALQDLSGASQSYRMRLALRDVRHSLIGGYPLSESLRRTGRFPEMVVAMARIGEETGALQRTMADAAQYIERIEAIKGAVMRALIYPAFTIVVMLAAMGFWLVFLLPKMAEMFRTMGIALPGMTLALLEVSNFLGRYWGLLLALAVALPLAIALARRQPAVRRFMDELLWQTPVVGRIIAGSQKAFFYQYLSVMYGAGMVITTAVESLRSSLQNAYFGHRVAMILDHLRAGAPFAESFRRAAVFSPLELRMVSLGEQTGNLDAQMKRLADVFFNRVQALVETLQKAIEPAIIVVIGGFFVMFAVGMIRPIYDVISRVGGGAP